jgi:Family of unknown function (DUF5677)
MDSEVIKLKFDPKLIEYGFPADWAKFAERHSEFTKRFNNLADTIDVAFHRIHEATSQAEKIVYFAGRTAVEDFMEVLLLCGNGYGIGAQKLLRGLYERVVTARYIFKHPEEAENFIDYFKITRHKFLVSVRSSMNSDLISDQAAEEIERDYKQVKERFMITDCEDCQTERLNHTWNKLDFASMARTDEALYRLLVPAYFEPTQEAHSTIGAVFSRLSPKSMETKDSLLFDYAAQEDRADRAIIAAHAILLVDLDLQRECFNIKELEPMLQTCGEDYIACLNENRTRHR